MADVRYQKKKKKTVKHAKEKIQLAKKKTFLINLNQKNCPSSFAN